MATDLKCAYLAGSGTLLNIANDTTVTDTRIRGIHCVGSGEYTIEAIDELSQVSRIRFQVSGSYTEDFTDAGVRMSGIVKVSAPASATYTTIYYG